MKTKRQEELVNSFLSNLNEKDRPLYEAIICCLSEQGYNPKKEGLRISFKHDLHNKQIAKMGMTRGKNPSPIFMLRFSACREYSQKFAEIVKEAALNYPEDARICINGGCVFCAGEPETHLYKYITPEGEIKYHCGSYALEIPDISADDINEIKELIKEENKYLLKHQAGIN